MIRVAICDDDQHCCNAINKMLIDYSLGKKVQIIVDIYFSGESLIKALYNSEKYDIIFLDIELVKMTGIVVGSKIRKELDDYMTKIVFISAKNSYDRQLFDIQPLNFLSKPVDKEKLFSCLDLAIKLLYGAEDVFKYKVNRDFIQIPYYKIIYFSNYLRKIKIQMFNGTDEFYGTFYSLEETLPDVFVRVHGSFIVNYRHISRLGSDCIFMINGDCIPVSHSRLGQIYKLQLKLFKEQKYDRL